MKLELRNDIRCNFCLKPINDPRDAHVLWECDRDDRPLIAVAHWYCDTGKVKQRYPSWEHLEGLIAYPKMVRIYFNYEIRHGILTPEEVKDGLEQIFQLIPDGYFCSPTRDRGESSHSNGSRVRSVTT